jgi:membrane-bound inhibitor of C-type lysozyme
MKSTTLLICLFSVLLVGCEVSPVVVPPTPVQHTVAAPTLLLPQPDTPHDKQARVPKNKGISFVCEDGTNFTIVLTSDKTTASLRLNGSKDVERLANRNVAAGAEYGDGRLTFRQHHDFAVLIRDEGSNTNKTVCKKI